MVDVVQHKVFPTIIDEFQYDMDYDEYKFVINELDEMESHEKTGLIIQTTDNLSKHIPKFTKKIYNITEHICKRYEYLYDRLEFTGMWANKLEKGDTHPPHTHSNNMLSGVYYSQSDNNAKIHFLDPRPQARVLTPKIKHNTDNNSGLMQYHSQTNYMIIFPSWLQHYVESSVSEQPRHSVAWNVMMRGLVGDPHQLQSATF